MCLYKHSQSDYSLIYIVGSVDLESSLSEPVETYRTVKVS